MIEKDNNAGTFYVLFINDGVIGAPGTLQAVINLNQAKMLSPANTTDGSTMKVNCKPTLDPWVSTVSGQITAVQKAQYGGFQFFSASELSVGGYSCLIEVDLIFTMKN